MTDHEATARVKQGNVAMRYGVQHLTASTCEPMSLPYRAYLIGIAVVPITGLVLFDFQSAVKVYAVIGAVFIGMLAAVLLFLNGNGRLVGDENRNSRFTTALLALALLVFALAGGFAIAGVIG